MAKHERTEPDRGALDFRGLLCLFVGLVGAFVFYANDDDGTRAAIWLVLFCGGGVAMIARAFKQEKLAGLLLIAVGIVAAGLIYSGDDGNLTGAIVLLVAGVGGGAYLMMLSPSR
jgi:hypothetical protein